VDRGLEKGLHSNGFSTLVVETGPEAAAITRDIDFDLMIPDLGLPEMDGQLVLDLRARRATVGHDSVELTAREFTLAETLLRHPGQVLSREQLLSHVWGYDFDPGSNIVDVYVGYLRKKLGDDVIETVRGMGYRLRS